MQVGLRVDADRARQDGIYEKVDPIEHDMAMPTLTISDRYCGPSQTGNGGYVGGLLARYLPGTASVRLRKGVPLEVELQVEVENSEVLLRHGDTIIAEFRPAECDLVAPEPPTYTEALEASKAFFGLERHAFPNCFVCGTKREVGDGLRIFPGAIEKRSLVAAPWIPDQHLADGRGNINSEFMWAPLECTGGFAWYPHFVVMGELTVRLDGTLRSGEKCVVAGWPLGNEGRKYIAGSAIYSESGKAVAVGRATWIEISREAFVALSRTGTSAS